MSEPSVLLASTWSPHSPSLLVIRISYRNESALCKTGLGENGVSLAMGNKYKGGNSSGGLEERREPHVLQLDSYALAQQPRWPPSLSIIPLGSALMDPFHLSSCAADNG